MILAALPHDHPAAVLCEPTVRPAQERGIIILTACSITSSRASLGIGFADLLFTLAVGSLS